MNRALEFHDSTVESISFSDGNLVIELSEAYIHESKGKPGISSGNGYYLAATISLFDAKALELSTTTGDLADGVVYVADQKFDLVPIPFEASGQIHAELIFFSGHRFSAMASKINVAVRGKPIWVEPFSGR